MFCQSVMHKGAGNDNRVIGIRTVSRALLSLLGFLHFWFFFACSIELSVSAFRLSVVHV